MAVDDRGIFRWDQDGKYYVIKDDGSNDGIGYDTPEEARAGAKISKVDWDSVRDDGVVVDTITSDEASDIELERHLKKLEESTKRRQSEAREQREADRVEGRARAEEVFAEGSLGRVQEDTPQNILDLLSERRSLSGEQFDMQADRLGEMGATQGAIQARQEEDVLRRQALTQSAAAGDIAETDRRAAELQRVTQDFDELIKGRLDPNSKVAKGLRERGLLGIDQQYQSNVSAARAAANAGNQKMIGALEADAMRSRITARRDLERDIMIENQARAEALSSEAAQVRNLNMQQLEQLRNTQIGRNDALAQAVEQLNLNQSAQRMQAQQQLADQTFGMTDRRSQELSRLEDMEAAIRQDQLQRQLINMQSQSNELFGRLSTEEGMVNQGIAERAGISQTVLAEAGAAENRRHQMEMEEIQRIEANKPPPSAGGGGKSILCVAFWQMGDLSDNILKGDFAFAKEHVDTDTRRGYFALSTHMAESIVTYGKSSVWYKIMRPFVVNWANEMASQMGVVEAKPNWIGKAMRAFGVPLCRVVGTVMRWCGYTEVANDRAKKILEKAGHLEVDLEQDIDKWLEDNRIPQV